MPQGYYDVPGMPYPMEYDLLGNPVNPRPGQMEGLDRATQTAVSQLSSRPSMPASRSPSNVTSFQVGPAVRLGVGRQDAQAIDALGPEYTAEANRLASLPSAQPGAMYAKIGDQEFYGTPGRRVSREALRAGVERVAMEQLAKKSQEAEAARHQRAMDLARVPGQAAVDLAKEKGRVASEDAAAERAYKQPEQAANIAKTQAETAAATARAGREQAQFTESQDPANKQRVAADAAIKALTESGAANTPEGRQIIAALVQLGTIGSRLPGNVAQQVGEAVSKPSPERAIAATQEVLADPTLTGLVDKIKASAQGALFASPQSKRIQNQHVQNLNNYVRKLAASKGVSPEEVFAMLAPDLEKYVTKESFGQSLAQSNPVTRGIDRFLGVERPEASVPIGR